MRGVSLLQNGMNWSGVCHDEVILGTSDPPESLSPVNYSATLELFLKPFHAWSRMAASF